MLIWTKLGSGPKLFWGPYILGLGLGLGQPRVLGPWNVILLHFT